MKLNILDICLPGMDLSSLSTQAITCLEFVFTCILAHFSLQKADF